MGKWKGICKISYLFDHNKNFLDYYSNKHLLFLYKNKRSMY